MQRLPVRRTLALGLIALALGGCTSDDGQAHLKVHTDDVADQYVADFDRAIFSQTPAGQTDLVLLAGSDTAVLTPDSPDAAVPGGSAVRQIVHVHVLWQPTRTIRVDSPSASNAMIDWHVIADDKDRVSYSGSCYANVSVDGDTASVDLREANVSIRQVVGQMNDPLKHARLEGRFVATRADATVQTYVTELAALEHKNATAALPEAATSAAPPARAAARP